MQVRGMFAATRSPRTPERSMTEPSHRQVHITQAVKRGRPGNLGPASQIA